MDQIIFGPNYFWTKLYTIENFGSWIKLIFGPNEPYRILDQIILGPNYFGPNYTRPQRVPVNWSEVIWSKIFGIPTLYKVVQTLVYGTPYRMVYRTVYRMVWVYRTIQLWTNLYRVLYGTVCTVLFEVVKVKGRQSNDDITCYRICLWKYAEKQ